MRASPKTLAREPLITAPAASRVSLIAAEVGQYLRRHPEETLTALAQVVRDHRALIRSQLTIGRRAAWAREIVAALDIDIGLELAGDDYDPLPAESH